MEKEEEALNHPRRETFVRDRLFKAHTLCLCLQSVFTAAAQKKKEEDATDEKMKSC